MPLIACFHILCRTLALEFYYFFHGCEVCTCAVSSIAPIATKTATDVRPVSVVTQRFGITFAGFRVCTLVNICNWKKIYGLTLTLGTELLRHWYSPCLTSPA